MAQVVEIVNTEIKTINTPFVAKQLRITNPTPFFLYINIGGSIPDQNRHQFRVQPNSDYTSQPFTGSIINIRSSGINPLAGYAQITCTDTATNDVISNPYVSPQFISNFPGYPLYGDGIQIPILPLITVEKFQTVFIQYSNPQGLSTDPILHCFKIIKNSSGVIVSYVSLGYFNQSGGVVTYVPVSVPETFEIFITTHDGSPLPTTGVINVVQSDILIEEIYPAPYVVTNMPPATLVNLYFGIDEPAFAFNVFFGVPPAVYSSFNYIFTIGVNIIPALYGIGGLNIKRPLIPNTVFSGTWSNNEIIQLIPEQVYIQTGLATIEVVINNGSLDGYPVNASVAQF